MNSYAGHYQRVPLRTMAILMRNTSGKCRFSPWENICCPHSQTRRLLQCELQRGLRHLAMLSMVFPSIHWNPPKHRFSCGHSGHTKNHSTTKNEFWSSWMIPQQENPMFVVRLICCRIIDRFPPAAPRSVRPTSQTHFAKSGDIPPTKKMYRTGVMAFNENHIEHHI